MRVYLRKKALYIQKYVSVYVYEIERERESVCVCSIIIGFNIEHMCLSNFLQGQLRKQQGRRLLFMRLIPVKFLYQLFGSALSGTIIIIGNGPRELTSNSGRGYLCFTQ